MSKENKEIFENLIKNKSYYDSNVRGNYGRNGKKIYDIENVDFEDFTYENGANVHRIWTDKIKGELLTYKGNKDDKIIMYIHGGGFLGGAAKDVRHVGAHCAKELGINAITITYPLAPEEPFPLGVNACAEAYKEIVRQYGEKNVYVMGESAGGNLVFASVLKAHDDGAPLPKALVSFSPVTQLEKTLDSYYTNDKTDAVCSYTIATEIQIEYLENKKENFSNKYASIKNADYTGFPPTLIVASSSEVLYEDSILLHNKMTQDGVDCRLLSYSGMIHAFPFTPFLPESKEVFEYIKMFFKNIE